METGVGIQQEETSFEKRKTHRLMTRTYLLGTMENVKRDVDSISLFLNHLEDPCPEDCPKDLKIFEESEKIAHQVASTLNKILAKLLAKRMKAEGITERYSQSPVQES